MPIPHKILTRKDEITASFFKLLNQHMEDILAGRVEKMHHIKDFAALLFIHPTHFSNTIKLTTGHSPCYFAEERTIDEARKMLSETPMSIAEISYKLTFNEPTNFTKFFKSFEGITPREFRRLRVEG
jgi:AraC family transcriptional regulator of adaptative response / methylphosphotriester-DNA alkyltransferase methyltransferase